MRRRILLLAGTQEARTLAAALVGDGYEVVATLAGATQAPKDYPCPVHVGGFGGAEGLARILREEQVDKLIDATHPFAERMAANAARAAMLAGVPRLKLLRPTWTRGPGDCWREFPTIAAAIAAFPAGARVFAATGGQSVGHFTRPDIWTALRVVDEPAGPPPFRGVWVVGEPARTETETDLFNEFGVTHLLTRNSGDARAASWRLRNR